jgi:hypothetical protein
VRSVIAAIAGDWEAARRVELVLPETGVCNTQFADDEAPVAASGCCGGPAPANVEACCIADAEAKAQGGSGCGCGRLEPVPVAPVIVAAAPKKAGCCGPAKA